ncbi:MAG: anti-sigma factor [Rhizobiaceae bacterium]
MTMHANSRDAMEALLPFYLNGTLDGADLEAVEAWLASDPNAMAALGHAEAELEADRAANEALRPPADALARFSKALDKEARPAFAPASFMSSLASRLFSAPPALAWAAAAALLAVVIAQAVMTRPGAGPEFEVAGADGPSVKADLLVAFKPAATAEAIAALLAQSGATIIDGPKPGGFFRLAIPAENTADYDRIVKQITDAPEIASMLPGKKP